MALCGCHTKKDISSTNQNDTNTIATSDNRVSTSKLDSFVISAEPMLVTPYPDSASNRSAVITYRYHIKANRATVKGEREFVSNDNIPMNKHLACVITEASDDSFESVHNYIGCDNIIRKGAIFARKGEKCIIPMNMRDGSLICIGKGNEDWNFSAPHGVGRIMSRSQAFKEISMDDFTQSMNGIYSETITEATKDESPIVYKPINEIIGNITDTVDVLNIIKPIFNFKSAE